MTPRDLSRLKRELGIKYAELVYDGLWFTPTRHAIDAFVATMQTKVTGQVRIRLFKGEHRVVGRRSPYSLYELALATYANGDAFDHTAAEGFIKLWGLPVETVARQEGKVAATTPAKTESAAPMIARAGVDADWVGL